MDDDNKTPRNLQLEVEKRRHSYYSFRKTYPGSQTSEMTHSENYARELAASGTRRRVLLALAFVLVFLTAFLFTDISIHISKTPTTAVQQTTAAAVQQTTADVQATSSTAAPATSAQDVSDTATQGE